MSKYKPGDIVRLKINPEQRVMILRVAWIDYPCDTSDCRYSYSARCGSGDTPTSSWKKYRQGRASSRISETAPKKS